MNTEFRKSLKVILVLMDLTVINLSWLTSYAFMLSNELLQTNNIFYSFAFFINLLWITTSLMFGLYEYHVINAFETFSQKTVHVYFLWIVFMTIMLSYAAELINMMDAFILFSVFAFLCLSANRFFYLGIKKYLTLQHDMVNRVLIIGFNDTAKKLAKYLEEDGLNTKLMGFVENEENMHELTTYPVFPDIENTVNVSKQLNIQQTNNKL